MPDSLLPALQRPDVRDAGLALRDWADAGVRIAAACIGTFVLAESGLLDEQDATTTWWLNPLFRQRYPAVRLNTSHMIVQSGQFLSCWGCLQPYGHDAVADTPEQPGTGHAGGQLSWWWIAGHHKSAYIISDHLSHADPMVQRFDRWARSNLEQGFNLDVAAAALATSKRTLARRIHEVLGKTPVSYVQDLRIEKAVHLLKTSKLGVEQIASLVGYADGVTLRTLLRRRLGKGVREIKLN